MFRKRLNPQVLIVGITATACLFVIWNLVPNTHTTIISTKPAPTPLPLVDRIMEQYVQTHHLTPPSTLPYKLAKESGHENTFTKVVVEFFGASKTSGVFIEAGAYNGESGSNTLYLEQLGWKGILVECNPWTLSSLRSKNRKAWLSDVCLSTNGTFSTVKFYSAPEWPASAQINKQLSLDEMKVHGIDWMKNKTWQEYERPSFPLQSIIAAVGEFQAIDFLSLDVQGAEIGVLKHYPFERFPIKLIIAEVFMFNAAERSELKALMISKGYELFKDLGNDYAFALTT